LNPIIGRRDAWVGARRGDAGQSTVEFALVLPLFFALLVLVFQVAVVGRDEILVTHAARAAVREATVTADPAAISAAATKSLAGARVEVLQRGAIGQPVEVRVTYTVHPGVPIVGSLLPDIALHASAVMQVER
jgi:Flp pilus assembly protein TadG